MHENCSVCLVSLDPEIDLLHLLNGSSDSCWALNIRPVVPHLLPRLLFFFYNTTSLELPIPFFLGRVNNKVNKKVFTPYSATPKELFDKSLIFS